MDRKKQGTGTSGASNAPGGKPTEHALVSLPMGKKVWERVDQIVPWQRKGTMGDPGKRGKGTCL